MQPDSAEAQDLLARYIAAFETYDIDRLVGRINGDLGRIGRPAISYLHASYPREEMAALFRAADIMVVTPYRDGMNLVAKEYVAAKRDESGVLVLSEFAGAAQEMFNAVQVNPYDPPAMADAIREALSMPERAMILSRTE